MGVGHTTLTFDRPHGFGSIKPLTLLQVDQD